MGTSHSKHQQYYQSLQKVHGYEKSSSKRPRSMTVSHGTNKDLLYSTDFNKKSTQRKEFREIRTDPQQKIKSAKVVYYSDEDVEIADKIVKRMQANKYNLRKVRANSDKKISFNEQSTMPNISSEEAIKIQSHEHLQNIPIIENLPSNNSIIEGQDSEISNQYFPRNKIKPETKIHKSMKMNTPNQLSRKSQNGDHNRQDRSDRKIGQIQHIIEQYYNNYNKGTQKPMSIESWAQNYGTNHIKYSRDYGSD